MSLRESIEQFGGVSIGIFNSKGVRPGFGVEQVGMGGRAYRIQG